METNVLPVRAAAEAKKCSKQTIYNALSRGDLTDAGFGSTRLVLTDEKWKDWEPKSTGRRASNENPKDPDS